MTAIAFSIDARFAGPIFLLVPQARPPGRLDIAGDAECVHEALPAPDCCVLGGEDIGPRLVFRRDAKAGP